MSPQPLSEALQQLLRDVPTRFQAERIDRVWVFAPREIGGRESGLVVLSLHGEAEDRSEQRSLVTWRYEATRERGTLRRVDSIAEQGRAPSDRIPRLIEGVLGRLRDATESPIAEAVGGDPERWTTFLTAVGAAPVDPT